MVTHKAGGRVESGAQRLWTRAAGLAYETNLGQRGRLETPLPPGLTVTEQT